MAVYRYRFCGSMYGKEKEGVSVRELKVRPVCRVTSDRLVPAGGVLSVSGNGGRLSGFVSVPVALVSTTPTSAASAPAPPGRREALPYDPEHTKLGTDSRYMDRVHEMAVKSKSIIAAMSIQMNMPGQDDILFLGAQSNPMSLNKHAPVKTEAIIGKEARRPMVLGHPVYISHMSSSAPSKETKTALATGNVMTHTTICSGEGGIFLQEKEAAYRYISEHVSNLYSAPEENLRRADAIETKIEQGIKPGMGGHLPGSKVTPKIAAVRGKPLSRDVISPSCLPGVNPKKDLKALVDRLREESEGGSIGIKIAAGKIEKDLEFCTYVGLDLITIDDRDGVTGASPKLIRDSTSVPIIYALYRVRRYLNEVGADMGLVITGGLRVSSDFAKALAMGTNVVAITSAALIAAACQQYRVCGTGVCSVRVAIQDEALRRRLLMDTAAQRMVSFLNASLEEIKTFTRITGHHNIHDMNVDGLCAISRETSEFIDIRRIQSSWKHRLAPGSPHEAAHP